MGSEGTLRVKVVGDTADAQAKFSAFGSSMQKFAGVAVGVAIGGAFAAMTRGALEMERAQGNFQAQTGRSRAEAVKFTADMNALVGQAGTVGRSFEEIATVGTTVAKQFGITGDQARDLTADILAFSRVVGSDANVTAGQLEDTLTSLGLSADDAAGFMDVLLASSQKYGTDVGPEMLSILQGIAPALQTLGLNANDAVGFLNAMEVAGIPATGAIKDLTAVVKEFPPGTTLDDVVAKLGAIEDPANRSRAAVELLGAKAGPQFALLVKPGMDSLDDFGVSADEAAGAVDRAADDMLTTTDKFRAFGEKVLAGAAEIGQKFGPALTGLASIGSIAAPFLSKIPWAKISAPLLSKATEIGASLLAKLFGSGAEAVAGEVVENLTKIGTRAGLEIGAEFGGAITESAGEAISEGAAGTIAGNLSSDAIKKGATGAGVTVGGTMAAGVIAGLSGAGLALALQAMLTDIDIELPGGFDLFPDWNKNIAQHNAAAAAAGTEIGTSAGVAVATAFESNTPQLTAAGVNAWVGFSTIAKPAAMAAGTSVGTVGGEAITEGLATGIQTAMPAFVSAASRFDPALHEAILQMHRDAAWGGEQTPGAFSEGLRSAFSTVQSAFKDLKDLMLNTLSPVKQEAELIGIATSQRLSKGLNDERDEVRGAAQQIALDTITQLERIKPGSQEAATLAMKLMASATVDQRPAIRDALGAILGVYDEQTGKFGQGGANLADSWGDRFMARMRQTSTDVQDVLNHIADTMHGQSPPKAGPLRNIDKGGWNIADAWAKSFTGRLRLGVAEITTMLGTMGAAAGGIGGAFSMGPAVAMSPFGHAGGPDPRASSYTGGPITVNAYGYAPGDVERELERAKRREALMWDLEPR